MVNFDKVIYHRTDTWPSYNELSQQPNIIIADFLKRIYFEGVFAEIKKIMDDYPKCGGVGHIVLIGICSAVDSLSAYSFGGGHVAGHFTSFIAKYFPNKYCGKEKLIYDTFRCDGVHGWNLHSSVISGIINDPHHLENKLGIPYVSLYDFFNDLIKAFDKFYAELKEDDDLKLNVLRRYKEVRRVVDKVKELMFVG